MPRATPTPEDIPLPGVQGQRPVASYDVSPWGAGAQAMAKGVETLGAGIQTAAKDIAEVRTYQARNSALLAQDNALGDAIQLREKYQPGGEKYTPDAPALTQNYQTDLDAIAEKHLSTIPEGPLRDHARARLQIPFAHELASVGAEARKRQIGDWRAGINDEADQLINTTGAQDDPLHSAKVRQWGVKVQDGLQHGYLTPVEAEKLQRDTARGVTGGEYRGRFRLSPDSAAAALRDLYMAQTGIVGPRATATFQHAASIISQAETGDPSLGPKALGNISPDSNGSRSYGFLGLNSRTGSAGAFKSQYGSQFGLTATPGSAAFDAQWRAASLNQTEPFRSAQVQYFNDNILPSVASNLQKAGVPVAAAADPRVATYFADRQVQMGTFGLNHAGEAWERSGGDIERFLRNMNEIDARPENLQSNFASAIASGVYNAKGHATRLQTRLNGALAAGGEVQGQGPPSPQGEGAPSGNQAYDILTPPQRDALIREGESILRAYRTDDDKARRDEERQLKETSDNTEAAIVNDLRNPNSTIDAAGLYDLYVKKGLSREAYERMLNYYDTRTKNVDKEDHDAKTYGSAFHALMERIHPQDGHLAPVTDPNQITDFYIQNPDQLTEAGREKLTGMIIANRKSVSDHAVNTAMTSQLAYAKSRLSFEQDTGPIKIRDPKGEAIFNSQFVPKFMAGYDAHLKAGKDPWQYLSRENVDGMLKGMRNPNEMNTDYIAAKGEATGEVGAPPEEKLPPTPEGVNPAAWVPLISKPPVTASGKPWPVSNWAAMIDDLRSDPTDEKKEAFDARFGKFGLKADDVLGKLAAPQATAAPAGQPSTSAGTMLGGGDNLTFEERRRRAVAQSAIEYAERGERAKTRRAGEAEAANIAAMNIVGTETPEQTTTRLATEKTRRIASLEQQERDLEKARRNSPLGGIAERDLAKVRAELAELRK